MIQRILHFVHKCKKKTSLNKNNSQQKKGIPIKKGMS